MSDSVVYFSFFIWLNGGFFLHFSSSLDCINSWLKIFLANENQSNDNSITIGFWNWKVNNYCRMKWYHALPKTINNVGEFNFLLLTKKITWGIRDITLWMARKGNYFDFKYNFTKSIFNIFCKYFSFRRWISNFIHLYICSLLS